MSGAQHPASIPGLPRGIYSYSIGACPRFTGLNEIPFLAMHFQLLLSDNYLFFYPIFDPIPHFCSISLNLLAKSYNPTRISFIFTKRTKKV
jgi:hypothetical protein